MKPEQGQQVAALVRDALRLKLDAEANSFLAEGLRHPQLLAETTLSFVEFAVIRDRRSTQYQRAKDLLEKLGTTSAPNQQPARQQRLAQKLADLRAKQKPVAPPIARTGTDKHVTPSDTDTRQTQDPDIPPVDTSTGTGGSQSTSNGQPQPVPSVGATIVVSPPPLAPPPYFECEIHVTKGRVHFDFRGPGIDSQPSAGFKLDEAKLNQSSDIQAYGARLYAALFSTEKIRTEYTHVAETARSQPTPAPVHVRLRIDPDLANLHRLAWEFLYDDKGEKNFLGGDPSTPFSRFLAHGATPAGAWPLGKRLGILFAVASPADIGNQAADDPLYRLDRLDLGIEIDVLKSAANAMRTQLSRLGVEFHYDILSTDRQPVSLEAIHNRLSSKEFQVLHVVAHGLVAGDIAQIVLEDDLHRAAPWDADLFAREIDPNYGVRLVFLAACQSGEQAAKDAYQGLAAQLIARNIPAVVAMTQKVDFETVHAFTQHFYTHLAYHGVVDRAMNAARRALYAGTDWKNQERALALAIPALFMRLKDGRLFETDNDAQSVKEPSIQVVSRSFGTQGYTDLERSMGDLVGQMGSRLANLRGLTAVQQQAVERRLFQIASSPPSDTQAGQARFVIFRNDPPRRMALLAGVAAYLQEPWRRHVLMLRELGRRMAFRTLRNAVKNPAFRNEEWQALFTASQVRIDGQPWQIADQGPTSPIPVAALAPPMALRAKLRADPDAVVTEGNLTWTAPAGVSVPTWDTRIAKAVSQVLADGVTENAALPQEIAAAVAHLARPDQALPYDTALAEAVQQWLGDPRYKSKPSSEEWLALARDLLADEDFDFTGLPDAFFFLQWAAAHRADAQRPAAALGGSRKIERPFVRTSLELHPDQIDSVLDLPEGTFPSLAAALNAGKHVILIGPPGTGKTTLAGDVCRYAAEQGFCRGYVPVTATADWTTFDTIGGYMPVPGGDLVFRPGIFLRAIRGNRWLIIDEINRSDIDKAFGELFSVLSGQGVTLPYERGENPIRILPPGQAPQSENDYVLHPNWRIIGTMNVYDKASLFAMSYAFMRRFAFIDVGVPKDDEYKRLLTTFVQSADGLSAENWPQLADTVWSIFDPKTPETWPLMRHRELGPAFAHDIVAYLGTRMRQLDTRMIAFDQALKQALTEAFNLYAIPQLDGLDRDAIIAIYAALHRVFDNDLAEKLIRPRIRGLFPHISATEFDTEVKKAQEDDLKAHAQPAGQGSGSGASGQ